MPLPRIRAFAPAPRQSLFCHSARSRCGDVQRHHPVASHAAAGRRLLRHDEPGQLLRATERAVEARAQPSAAHGLGGIAGRLPNIVADCLATRWATTTSGLGSARPRGLPMRFCRSSRVTDLNRRKPANEFLRASVFRTAPGQHARQRSSHRAPGGRPARPLPSTYDCCVGSPGACFASGATASRDPWRRLSLVRRSSHPTVSGVHRDTLARVSGR